MTNEEEYLKEWQVDEKGFILAPGKFQGEFAYAPLAYQDYLDGKGVEDKSGLMKVPFPDKARKFFGKRWARRKWVKFFISDNGFFYEELP